MKLSVVIADADAPKSAFVVWRDFEASIEKAARMGFQGVELALGEAAELAFKPGLDRLVRTE